ncbi:MAG: hypothetical protein ACR2ND_08380 [Solirubrobacteraceae bacterium]
MTIRELQRSTVEGCLRAARLPFDLAGHALGQARPDAARRLARTLDRVEAGARSTAGMLLGDQQLRRDGDLLERAADERDRAQRLRDQAARHADRSDEALDARQTQAEKRRATSRREAEQRKQQAEERRRKKTERAARVEQKLQGASSRVAAEEREQLDKAARGARLQTLETKSEALEREGRALTARDEAQRLAKAAAAVKAERKNGRR